MIFIPLGPIGDRPAEAAMSCSHSQELPCSRSLFQPPPFGPLPIILPPRQPPRQVRGWCRPAPAGSGDRAGAVHTRCELRPADAGRELFLCTKSGGDLSAMRGPTGALPRPAHLHARVQRGARAALRSLAQQPALDEFQEHGRSSCTAVPASVPHQRSLSGAADMQKPPEFRRLA